MVVSEGVERSSGWGVHVGIALDKGADTCVAGAVRSQKVDPFGMQALGHLRMGLDPIDQLVGIVLEVVQPERLEGGVL